MVHSEAFVRLVADAKTRIEEISRAELDRRLAAGEEPVLIDVREDHEWSGGHIPRAVHLGRGILERDIEGLVPDRSRCIVLYCGGGFRSALAADNLQRMGYARVLSLAEGYRGWTGEGRPVEK